MKAYFFIIFSVISISLIQAQTTVGILQINEAEVFDGYNLFFPHTQNDVFLMNNCGELVHTWEDSIYKPGNTVYLMPNGDIVRCGSRGNISNPNIHAGGGGEMVERLDWDGNLLWRYFVNDSINRMHHDVEVLPNGNILIIAWELKNIAQVDSAGRDTSLVQFNEIWSEQILEIEPITMDSFHIVWEWHAWDHLIQDFDSLKNNYGIISEHPELINANYDNNAGFADWLHINSIDYNEDLDQIILSVPFFNEVWILDHSTTSTEAASHSGGTSNIGGDLLFRWGNPAAYNSGTLADQKLFFQHDAHWIDLNLEPGDVDYGKIAFFNNRVDGGSYSTVNIIDAPFDLITNTYTKTANMYNPIDFDWTFVREDTSMMYSKGLAGLQKLKNGNTLICSGRQGNIFEINENEEIVWEFENPMLNGIPVTQGDILNVADNSVFRMYRYPSDYSAFNGRDLSSKGFIELNPVSLCLSDPIKDIEQSIFTLSPNPTNNFIQVQFKSQEENLIEVYSISGKRVYSQSVVSTKIDIDTKVWTKGLYFVKVNYSQSEKVIVY